MSGRRPIVNFRYGIVPNPRLLGLEEELQRLNDGLADNDSLLNLMRQVLAVGSNPLNLNDNPLRRRRLNDNERNMVALYRFARQELTHEAIENARVQAIIPQGRVPNLPEASSSETSDSNRSDDGLPPDDNEVLTNAEDAEKVDKSPDPEESPNVMQFL